VPAIDLRPATPADEAFVNRLTRDVMRGYVEATWPDDAARERYYEQNRFVLATTRIIRCDGADVGRVSLTRGADAWVVDEIHLLPSHQSRGIGAEVLKRILDEAGAVPVPVELHVLKVNPAKALYDRLGFRVYREDDERFHMRRT
jgi:ribosomal protein S18 acetylase RimI-like enzyme